MPGDKIALIGDNGAGKTTLLRLIAGSETPDPEFGSIKLARGTVVGYLEQQLDHLNANSDFALEDPEIAAVEQEILDLQTELENCSDNNLDILMQKYAGAQDRYEALGGFSFRQRLQATLNAFSLDETTIRRPLEYLSGGERMRVALARLLLRSPDLLLLDEPTNHLDQKAIDWLEDYLNKMTSAVLFVSHDRAFINKVANKTAELNTGKIRMYSGNYTKYLEQKAFEEKTLERRIYHIEKKLQRQEEITQTMLSHRKIAQYHSSEIKESRISDELAALRNFKRSSHKRMSFKPVQEPAQTSSRREQIAMEVKDLSVRFEGESDPIFENLTFNLIKGKHLVLVGRNGCGKTTLLKTLMGEIHQNKGTIRSAANLTFAFLGQEAKFDDYEKTVLEQLLILQPQLNDAKARSELARVGFSGDTVFHKTGSLSGGERSRLFLCALLQDKPDVLFMDEPTNHLDIYSRELLEDALNEFTGTILAVSHDRYFIEHIAEEVWGMLDGGIDVFSNLAEYREAERVAGRKKIESKKPDPLEALPEKQLKTAVSSEKPLEMPLWDDREIHLYPLLANLKQYPANKSERRRVVADINKLLREVDSNLSRHQEEKISLEKNFTRVESGEIYHDYADLLQTIEAEELLYLQLMEIAEDIKS
ncbi:MAG: ABC-F family ATP-binding cassette domain-containing protein [Clostridiaceae bacterium]|nr:ABC-F family ATP-binding cassette domain-containing protein [Clostridiaceae bacterium]